MAFFYRFDARCWLQHGPCHVACATPGRSLAWACFVRWFGGRLPNAPLCASNCRVGGPWLVYGRVDDRFHIRPRVVLTHSLAASHRTRLVQLVLSSEAASRRQDLKELLQSGAVTDQELDEVRALIVSFQTSAPLQSLDLAIALIAAPETAVRLLSTCSEKELDMVLALEQEMDFLWCATPVASWRKAFKIRKEGRLALMAALPSADAARYASEDTKAILEAIAARQPALAFHVFSLTGGRVDNWLVDSSREASECVARNTGEGVFWPTDLGLANRLGPALPDCVRGKQTYCWDVLAAPFAVAGMAAGTILREQKLISSLLLGSPVRPYLF